MLLKSFQLGAVNLLNETFFFFEGDLVIMDHPSNKGFGFW